MCKKKWKKNMFQWCFIDFGTQGVSFSIDFGTLDPPFSGLGAVLATKFVLAPFWHHFWEALGAIWEPPEAILGASWGPEPPKRSPRTSKMRPKTSPNWRLLAISFLASIFNDFLIIFWWIFQWFFLPFLIRFGTCENLKNWRQYNGFAWFFTIRKVCF